MQPAAPPDPEDTTQDRPAPVRSMSQGEIAAVLAQTSAQLVGGVIQRVREPMPHHIAISVRTDGHNATLLLGVAAGAARVHLATTLPATPPHPSPFAQLARKYLRPARITEFSQLPDERILLLRVSQHRQEAGDWQTTLVAELFPRGRLLLLDGQGHLLAATGPGGLRELSIGAPYQPPAAGNRKGDATPVDIDSATLEARYLAGQTSQHDAEKRQAAHRLRQRIHRRIRQMQQDLARMANWQTVQQEGELLSAHRHLLQAGMTQVEVTDWFSDGTPRRHIALDPTRSPDANIQQCFKRAQKARRGIPILEQRLHDAKAQLAQVSEATVAVPAPQTARTRKQNEALAGIRRFAVADGWQVWVGRSATVNDRLTFRVARGNDRWLHARDQAGAHVVMRGNGDPPQQVILQAAQLAAHFSRLKQAGGGEVMITQGKYLRRPKGGKPGQVLVTQERTLHVRLTPDAMSVLLATRLRE